MNDTTTAPDRLTTAEFSAVLGARSLAVRKAGRYSGFDPDPSFAVECAEVAMDVARRAALASRPDPWDVECDPADWPDDTDADLWGLTEAAPLASTWSAPFEPSLADRAYWAEVSDAEERLVSAVDRLETEGAALVAVLAGLTAFAPVCGGSPADSKPIKLRPWDDKTGVRSRPQPNIRDEDVITATGCCG